MAKKPHIAISDQPGVRLAQIEFTQELERRGFPAVWAPSRGDNVAFLLAILDRTENINVGTGIANIYLRHPHLMGQAASLIEELHPGRLMLGIGVSHGPMHQALALTVGRPLEDTREYVRAMRSAAEGESFPRLVLAALRRRMTALAGEIAEGAIWANGIRSHMATSLHEVSVEGRDGFFVGNLIVTAVEDDRRAALAAARRGLRRYFELPNYQRYFEEAGYHEEVAAARLALSKGDNEAFERAVTESFIADSCLAGTASEVKEQAEAWEAEGVTLVLSPMARDSSAMQAALTAFE